jgi:hypothetical protein
MLVDSTVKPMGTVRIKGVCFGGNFEHATDAKSCRPIGGRTRRSTLKKYDTHLAQDLVKEVLIDPRRSSARNREPRLLKNSWG